MDMADPSFLIGFEQAAADVEAGRVVHLSAVEDDVIGGAAADVDVEHAGRIAAREFRRTGAMSGNDRLEVRPGRGHHEIAERFRQLHYRLPRIAGLRCLAGDDDRATLDLLPTHACQAVLFVNKPTQLGDPDMAIMFDRREYDGTDIGDFAP